jgi:hypothetical protein
MLSGRTHQDSKRKPANKGHSLSVEYKGRLITSAKESQRLRGTHGLVEGRGGRFIRTAKESLRVQANSRPVECRVSLSSR